MKKSSQKWSEEVESYIKVLDPDGWDRTLFIYSWFEEEISKKEFIKRVNISTVKFKNFDKWLAWQNENEYKIFQELQEEFNKTEDYK